MPRQSCLSVSMAMTKQLWQCWQDGRWADAVWSRYCILTSFCHLKVPLKTLQFTFWVLSVKANQKRKEKKSLPFWCAETALKFSDGDFLIPITPDTLKINMNFVKQLYKLYTFYNVTAFIASRPVAGWRSARGLWGRAWRRWSQRSCCETLALCAPPDLLRSWTAVSPQPAGANPPALSATAETGQFQHKAVTSWCRPSSTKFDSWNRSISTQSCNQLVQALQHRVRQLKQVNFNTKL